MPFSHRLMSKAMQQHHCEQTLSMRVEEEAALVLKKCVDFIFSDDTIVARNCRRLQGVC